MKSILPTDLVFDAQKLWAVLPHRVMEGKEFKQHQQLGLTHALGRESWFESVGSLYDYQKKEFIKSTADFTVLNKIFVNTYLSEVVESVRELAVKDSVKLGRIRIMHLPPKTCYTLHWDLEEFRYHIPLKTNPKVFFVNDFKIDFMPNEGRLYKFKTKELHTAVNASFEDRYHLVFDTYE